MAEGKVTVIARIKAKTGEVQRVKEELLKLLAPTRAENGCINFDMHQGAADHSQFLFHENWTSRAHLDAHLQNTHVQVLLPRLNELAVGMPEIKIWEKIA